MRVAIDRCIESYNARLAPGEPPMNQVLLARALGLDQSTISRWQSGERAVSLYLDRSLEVLPHPEGWHLVFGHSPDDARRLSPDSRVTRTGPAEATGRLFLG